MDTLYQLNAAELSIKLPKSFKALLYQKTIGIEVCEIELGDHLTCPKGPALPKVRCFR